MTGGFVTGGWEYVIAAYSITFVAFGAYAGYAFARLRRETRKESSEETR